MKTRLLIGMSLTLALVLTLALTIAAQGGEVNASLPQDQLAVAETHFANLPLVMHNHTHVCTHPPQLISPADGSQLDTLVPTFTFGAGSEPGPWSYMAVTIDSDPAFSSPDWVSIGGTSSPRTYRITWNLEPATRYYWRVALFCDSRGSPWSSTYSFVTGSGGTIPPAPQLVSPISGTVGLTRPVTLEWNAVSGAGQYLAHINLAGQLGGYEYGTSETTYDVYSGVQPDTTYEWYVRARNDYAYGPESEHWLFTTGSFPASLHTVSEPDVSIIVIEELGTRIEAR